MLSSLVSCSQRCNRRTNWTRELWIQRVNGVTRGEMEGERREIERERRHIYGFNFHIFWIPFGFKECLLSQIAFQSCRYELVDTSQGKNTHFSHPSPGQNQEAESCANTIHSLKLMFSTVSGALVWLECWHWGLCCPTQFILGAGFRLTLGEGKYRCTCFRKPVL